MIEKEMSLNCNQKHKQRIEKVSSDPQLNKSDKLLCYTSLLNPKFDDKQINFNAIFQVIQDKYKFKKQQFENILNTNLGQIEQLQRDPCIFKIKLIQQPVKIVQFTNEWIQILNNFFIKLLNIVYLIQFIIQLEMTRQYLKINKIYFHKLINSINDNMLIILLIKYQIQNKRNCQSRILRI
ncbi:unnamed protein product [Paramecium pentaurelia]|uniref:Uncharacterized protein n=1 Tax=Paramecium pentaurelia TaxID=43138 RepID=A0A8S1SMU3_9CILI|nr:unnamed protein product [Paramecium pentaurelia]